MITHGIYKPKITNSVIAISTEELKILANKGTMFFPVWICECIKASMITFGDDAFSFYDGKEWINVSYNINKIIIYKRGELSIMDEKSFNSNYEEII